MAQIKIFGLREHLAPLRPAFSDAVHKCVVEVLHFPAEKRCHRFFLFEDEDFYMPDFKSRRYTILEISMFEGRSLDTKKRLIRALFEEVNTRFGMQPDDLEITIFETPRHNWGIRGLPADEIGLNYTIEI